MLIELSITTFPHTHSTHVQEGPAAALQGDFPALKMLSAGVLLHLDL